jgi:hypothetical protein
MNISAMASTHSHSTMRVSESDDRNACILAALERAGGMIRNYARAHELDFEDLYQDIAELMLRVYDRIPADVQSKIGYLYGVARLEMRVIVARLDRESLHPLSIDLPLYGPNDVETIAETVPDTTVVQDTARIDEIIETVHSVLHDCMLEEQEYVMRVHGLTAFTPMAPEKRRPNLKDSGRKTDHMLRSIRRVFRKHPQAQALVQRETAVL